MYNISCKASYRASPNFNILIDWEIREMIIVIINNSAVTSMYTLNKNMGKKHDIKPCHGYRELKFQGLHKLAREMAIYQWLMLKIDELKIRAARLFRKCFFFSSYFYPIKKKYLKIIISYSWIYNIQLKTKFVLLFSSSSSSPSHSW